MCGNFFLYGIISLGCNSFKNLTCFPRKNIQFPSPWHVCSSIEDILILNPWDEENEYVGKYHFYCIKKAYKKLRICLNNP